MEDENYEMDIELETPPPSVRQNEPLIQSYSFFSGPDTDNEDEYILGVDEAGRGSCLGPQVYGVAFCKADFEDDLRQMGFADSKTLTHEKRKRLLELICSTSQDLHWAVRVMSPHDLSRGMLQRTPYNLNAQSHDATVMLIRQVISKGYRLTKVYVDTVGPTAAYQAKLESIFPTLSFVVESKADFTYPIVGAASIAAKVTRDAAIQNWTFMEKGKNPLSDWGSGYPSDPRCVNWMDEHVERVFGLPNVARFSWKNVQALLEKNSARVQWMEEGGSIQRYFQPSKLPPRPALYKAYALAPVAAF